MRRGFDLDRLGAGQRRFSRGPARGRGRAGASPHPGRHGGPRWGWLRLRARPGARALRIERSPSPAGASSTCRLRASWRRDGALDGDAGGEVAHHAALGGNHDLAARASLAGGRHAIRIFANEEAARLARFGAQHAAKLPAAQRLPLQVALLGVLAYSNAWRTPRRRTGRGARDPISECEMEGLPAVAAAGLQTLSLVQYENGKLDSAMTSSLHRSRARRRWGPERRPRVSRSPPAV